MLMLRHTSLPAGTYRSLTNFIIVLSHFNTGHFGSQPFSREIVPSNGWNLALIVGTLRSKIRCVSTPTIASGAVAVVCPAAFGVQAVGWFLLVNILPHVPVAFTVAASKYSAKLSSKRTHRPPFCNHQSPSMCRAPPRNAVG